MVEQEVNCLFCWIRPKFPSAVHIIFENKLDNLPALFNEYISKYCTKKVGFIHHTSVSIHVFVLGGFALVIVSSI